MKSACAANIANHSNGLYCFQVNNGWCCQLVFINLNSYGNSLAGALTSAVGASGGFNLVARMVGTLLAIPIGVRRLGVQHAPAVPI